MSESLRGSVHLAASATRDEREQQRSECLFDLLAHDITSAMRSRSVHPAGKGNMHSSSFSLHVFLRVSRLSMMCRYSWVGVVCRDSMQPPPTAPSVSCWTNRATHLGEVACLDNTSWKDRGEGPRRPWQAHDISGQPVLRFGRGAPWLRRASPHTAVFCKKRRVGAERWKRR